MSNMSYCRFRNTLKDLRDVADNMESVDDDDTEELQAREALIEICQDIADNYGEPS